MRNSVRDAALSIIGAANDLTLATVCADGAPHATVVSYANDGLRIYFGCGPDSRKAQNLARDGRVAATITLPYAEWGAIRGVSLMGKARRIEDMAEIGRMAELFARKFPQVGDYVSASSQAVRFFELTPSAISVLDYAKGFGHTDRAVLGEVDLVA